MHHISIFLSIFVVGGVGGGGGKGGDMPIYIAFRYFFMLTVWAP